MEEQSENCRAALTYRLCCPRPKLDLPCQSSSVGIGASLSFLPWRIREGDNGGETPGNATPDDVARQLLPSYLDLRRQQNVEFADEKCREANNLLESSTSKGEDIDAKTSFAQALELVPNHLDSLIGYGKLLIQTGNCSKAEGFLKSALRVDKDNVEARHCLAKLREKRKHTMLGGGDNAALSYSYSLSGGRNCYQPQDARNLMLLNNDSNHKTQKKLTARESSAYIDALMERNLHAGPTPQQMDNDAADANEGDDRGSSSDDSIRDQSDRDHRRGKKKPKKKDRHRKEKRKYSRTSKSRKRKSKERKHKKKRSSRRYIRDDLSSYSSSSSSSSLSSYASSYASSPSHSHSSVPSVISANFQSSTATHVNEKMVGGAENHFKSTTTNSCERQHYSSFRTKREDPNDVEYDQDDTKEGGDSSRRHKKRRRRRHDADTKRRHKRKKDPKRQKRRKDYRRTET
mmetsp:Transcript_22547/g.47324  ORF Transcript_22547/g.47324 Transcript_22547/m.47324 type:complete len:460 (+) Transcript_22547:70-1449(+)